MVSPTTALPAGDPDDQALSTQLFQRSFGDDCAGGYLPSRR
ncbi:MAG: hypothetical protein R2856_03290 [Caldilineaceae bacterium]